MTTFALSTVYKHHERPAEWAGFHCVVYHPPTIVAVAVLPYTIIKLITIGFPLYYDQVNSIPLSTQQGIV